MTALFSVVVDTNVVLDLLVFKDPSASALDRSLQSGETRWLATPAMRDELARVLDYPQLAQRLQKMALSAQQVLAVFDGKSHKTAEARQSEVRCSDPDDQIFIDLAVAHGALLLSKDQAVLGLKKQLSAWGVHAQSTLSLPFAAMP